MDAAAQAGGAGPCRACLCLPAARSPRRRGAAFRPPLRVLGGDPSAPARGGAGSRDPERVLRQSAAGCGGRPPCGRCPAFLAQPPHRCPLVRSGMARDRGPDAHQMVCGRALDLPPQVASRHVPQRDLPVGAPSRGGPLRDAGIRPPHPAWDVGRLLVCAQPGRYGCPGEGGDFPGVRRAERLPVQRGHVPDPRRARIQPPWRPPGRDHPPQAGHL